jgi:hypothetical protein
MSISREQYVTEHRDERYLTLLLREGISVQMRLVREI